MISKKKEIAILSLLIIISVFSSCYLVYIGQKYLAFTVSPLIFFLLSGFIFAWLNRDKYRKRDGK